jgi:outer membrane protein assembly factor BamD (BamD/ComL family)
VYFKGKALIEKTEYQRAIDVLKSLKGNESNEEVAKELARAELLFKNYQSKETKMFQKMF